MIQAGQLTEEQKDLLIGEMFAPDSYYNPIQDCNDIWIISQTEMDLTTDPTYLWIKSLPLIDYCPKPDPDYEI